MKQNNRFIASVVKTAKEETTVLPYQRGARRVEFISRRKKPIQETRKSA